MPARDAYHDIVRRALEKDNWTITHDPMRLTYDVDDVYVDLAAERLLAAERGHEKIAVEIKTFRGASPMRDLEAALGQYMLYRAVLRQNDPERLLFLAVPKRAYENVISKAIARLSLADSSVRVFAFDPEQEEILTWITPPATAI